MMHEYVPELQGAPSKMMFYKKFEEGDNSCEHGGSTDGIMRTLKEKLRQHTTIGTHFDKIAGAVCSASRMPERKGAAYDTDRCNFLYYWVGGELLGKLGNEQWTAAIQDIPSVLQEFFNEGTCKIIDEQNIDRNTFNKRKVLYEYYHDQSVIWTEVLSPGSACASKYGKYLGDIISVYREVQQDCNKNAMDPYCVWFTKWFTKSNNPEKLRETCITQEVEPVGIPGVGMEMPKDLLLRSLPSSIMYNNFLSRTKFCMRGDSHEEVRNKVEQELLGYPDIKTYADRIVQAWCYACGSRGNGVFKDEPCHFFYYWIVNILWGSSGIRSSFWDVVRRIYDKLGEVGVRSKCDILYRDITKDEFERRKRMFEYSQDCDAIQMHLAAYSSSCNGDYVDYLKGIFSIYDNVYRSCAHNSEQHCSEFRAKYEEHGHDKALKMACTAIPAGDRVDTRASPLGAGAPGGSTTSIPGAVGGGLASVALPAVGLLLYKYTSLFDGIKKSLFGGSNNRRGRRSTVRHTDHHFNGFDSSTMGDDSSTLGGDGSTTLGGGGSSTLGGSSTDISTIYNDDDRGRRRRLSPPKGRAGTNNRRQGNIRYYAT
ncbi:KIR protein [Plasmodium knowlesi strain H]|uniref:KIR protein n=3 Tax=Plasmodium knowlesi TaxID=5850 RepID=B3L2W5_PLAKH|nr:KIR protein [Plasmodium knowlesi strain H]OTN67241.1 KIR protein [Plasmodium knowlesi]CAA9987566.1 KIR protein [Plasmodium knowlesi strain H]SBO27042.1 KIR protein [Plasmodium knowlesi strain H]VVS77040.1 KIR protein [Plasmodium knowlesi strain H]|eukprot:XP_002258569.1 KIR protein [Plasmodium knowlesi strain H]